MKVNRGTGKHPHPHDNDQIEGHVEQVQNHPGQRRQTGGLHGRHGSCFLHDEKSRVAQDEGMSRDVVAIPVEAGTPAGDFGGELRLCNVCGRRFKTDTADVLDVEECLSEDVPNSCGHHQGQEPPAEEGHTPAEAGVGKEQEGCQQQ